MIYDCVMVDDELDLLELRIKILRSKVDKFIVIESRESFTGRPKPSHVSNNLSRFLKLANTECYSIELPKGATPLQREEYQRNYIKKVLFPRSNDLTFISDLDEILPVDKLFDNSELPIVYYVMQTSYYYINNVVVEPQNHNKWVGSVRITGSITKDPQQLRMSRWQGPFIDGGYHWSFLGNPQTISNKLNNTHHQECNTPEFNNLKNIEDCIKNGKDVVGRDFKFKLEDLNKFPNQVLEYPQLILEKI